MRIGIVLHPYGEDRPAGLARTIFELAKGMLETDRENEYVIFLKNAPKKPPELPGKNWKVEPLGGGRFWLDRLRKATPVDVCIFNTPVLPLFFRPRHSIVLALDFAYAYLAEPGIASALRRRLTLFYHGRSMRRADRIVAISEATKRDVVKLFGIPPERVDVVLCGYKPICSVPETPLPLPEGKFFLFVGIVKPRKNVMNIVRAFVSFAKRRAGYSLVVGGSGEPSYLAAIKDFLVSEGMADRVLFLGHLNDGELSYAYKRAAALAFPTLIEGFGYPVLEGMDCGIPVITSNQSSLAEVGGDAALLVDPYDPEDIARAMERLAGEPGLAAELVRRGKERVKLFSWRKAARELSAVIRSVA